MRVIILFFLVLASGIPAYAANEPACVQGDRSVTKKIEGFEIQISPYPDKDDPLLDECETEIYDPRGDVIFSEHDWSFVIELAGADVNGDGIPDVVLEAYSGGAHCCWTYYIISLGAKPGLLKKFENDRGVSLYRAKNGRIEFTTQDGAFEYFDAVCHACTPFTLVYLRLDGTDLVDISPRNMDEYDDIISQTRKTLTAAQLQRLRALKSNPSDTAKPDGTVAKALTIVLAYLYSGRETQAREALQKMWPPFDQERMWKLILETRRCGILCYTRKNAACGPDSTSE